VPDAAGKITRLADATFSLAVTFASLATTIERPLLAMGTLLIIVVKTGT
jgi:hypothetical protein